MSSALRSRLETAQILVQNWEEARWLGVGLIGWIFRGQADSSWPLKHSLERAAFRRNSDSQSARTNLWWTEEQLVQRFQSAGAHLILSPPDLGNTVEWLALLRHHGGPSRLLDFTRSFYAAAFFAAEHSTTEAAVWALDMHAVYRERDDLPGSLVEISAAQQRETNELLTSGLKWEGTRPVEPRPPAVQVFEPARLNEREVRQQGLYVMPTSLMYSVAHCIGASLGIDADRVSEPQATLSVQDFYASDSRPWAVLKILLPKDMHAAMIGDLGRMNVSAATLFPGIDGFARSLGNAYGLAGFVPPEQYGTRPPSGA